MKKGGKERVESRKGKRLVDMEEKREGRHREERER